MIGCHVNVLSRTYKWIHGVWRVCQSVCVCVYVCVREHVKEKEERESRRGEEGSGGRKGASTSIVVPKVENWYVSLHFKWATTNVSTALITIISIRTYPPYIWYAMLRSNHVARMRLICIRSSGRRLQKKCRQTITGHKAHAQYKVHTRPIMQSLNLS